MPILAGARGAESEIQPEERAEKAGGRRAAGGTDVPGTLGGDMGSGPRITAGGGRQEAPPASPFGRRLPRIPQSADHRLHMSWQPHLSRPWHRQSHS